MHHRANVPLDVDLCHLLQAMQLESIGKQVSLLRRDIATAIYISLEKAVDSGVKQGRRYHDRESELPRMSALSEKLTRSNGCW